MGDFWNMGDFWIIGDWWIMGDFWTMGDFWFMVDILIMGDSSLAFQAGTAKNLSLTDYNKSKNLIGTPELKTNLSLHGTIFSGSFFKRKKTFNRHIS